MLNKYPLNSYFKNIIMQGNGCKILTNDNKIINSKDKRSGNKNKNKSKSKESDEKFVSFYIG